MLATYTYIVNYELSYEEVQRCDVVTVRGYTVCVELCFMKYLGNGYTVYC
jgi:hypothetical protein